MHACMYATVIEHMGISQGLHTMRALEEMDATRVKSADRKASEGARQARKRRRRVIHIVPVRCCAYDTSYASAWQDCLCKENKLSWNQASMCAGQSHMAQWTCWRKRRSLRPLPELEQDGNDIVHFIIQALCPCIHIHLL